MAVDYWMRMTIPREIIAECRSAVYESAKAYDVPPVLITAHSRCVRADHARKWVMRYMVSHMRMKRWQVALIFGRDLRRVRKSVLGV